MDFWTLWERERVGWFGRMALKHVYYQVRYESPVYVQYRIQDAWGWCTGMIQRDDTRCEVGGGSGLGTHVHPWMIHVNVWQNEYSIVKQNKVKINIKKILPSWLSLFVSIILYSFHCYCKWDYFVDFLFAWLMCRNTSDHSMWIFVSCNFS